MKKTDRKIALYSRHMGWDIIRVIYLDDSGRKYVKINGYYSDLDWCLEQCDCAHEDFARNF